MEGWRDGGMDGYTAGWMVVDCSLKHDPPATTSYDSALTWLPPPTSANAIFPFDYTLQPQPQNLSNPTSHPEALPFPRSDLTESVYKVVLRKSIPTQICLLIPYISNSTG